MNRNKGILTGAPIVTFVLGILAVVIIALLIAPGQMEAQGAEFYNVQYIAASKTQGQFQGPVSNGNALTDKDVVNITAVNESVPSPRPTSDILTVDILVNNSAGVNQYIVPWGLTYEGASVLFSGDVTLDKDLASDHSFTSSGVSLRVADGYNITFRKKGTTDSPLLFFGVDLGGPSISPVEPGNTVAAYDGRTYAKSGGKINLRVSDMAAQQQWFIDNDKVKFRWDSGSWNDWDGSQITIPSGLGAHDLSVNATDPFGYYTNWAKEYNVTFFLTESKLQDNLTLTGKTVFISTMEIDSPMKLILRDSRLVFLNSNDQLVVNGGAAFSLYNVSVGSLGEPYTIFSEKDCSMRINASTITGSRYSLPDTSILSLESGWIHNTTFNEINNRIAIRGAGVELLHSRIDLKGSGGIYVDLDHGWSTSQTRIMNNTINGTAAIPVQIKNTSVWNPYDVTSAYYADDGNEVAFYLVNTSGLTDPYFKLPYFVDSRHIDGVFEIGYNVSTSWEYFPGFPMSGIQFDEWVNGEDARLDLSSISGDLVQIRVKWITPGTGYGCAYLGPAKLGADEIGEIGPGGPRFLNEILETWGPKASSDVLLVQNLTIENASVNFMHVRSSGRTTLREITTGTNLTDHPAKKLVRIEDSGIILLASKLMGNNNTEIAVEHTDSTTNDWGGSFLKDLIIGKYETGPYDPAVYSEGGWLELDNVGVDSSIVAVDIKDGFLNARSLSLNPGMSGIKISLPESYPRNAQMSIMDSRIMSSYNTSAVHVNGDGLDYVFTLNIEHLDANSDTSRSFSREDEVGTITLDLTSSKPAYANIRANLTQGPSHGMAIPRWPADGHLNLTRMRITQMDIDGIYMGDDLNVTMDSLYISDCYNYGIYGGDDLKISMIGNGTTGFKVKDLNRGGIRFGRETDLFINNLNISSSRGAALDMGIDADVLARDLSVFNCESGITFKQGSKIELMGVKIEGTTAGLGITAKNSDLILGKGNINRQSRINENNGDAVFITGGTLNITRTDLIGNTGTGLKLDNTRIIALEDVTINENVGDGLSAHIGSPSLLDQRRYYASLLDCDILNNQGIGLKITYDPTQIMGVIEIGLEGPVIGGNRGGEIIAPSNLHFNWVSSTNTRDLIGSADTTGVTRANIDLVIEPGASAGLINQNLTLLGDAKQFNVGQGSELKLTNCYVRPSQSSYRFSITGVENSRINIAGGYLGQLYRLHMKDSNQLWIDGTVVKFGEGPIVLEGTSVDIKDSKFSNIDGTALSITNGGGTITGSRFSDNTVGIQIEGLENNIRIEDTEFIDNNWGAYIFDDSGRKVEIVDSYFSGNSPAPIWTKNANAYLLDTDINPYRIQATMASYDVFVNYTLKISLIDESGNFVDFDLRVDRGNGDRVTTHQGVREFSRSFESYRVQSTGIVDDWVDVALTITYVEGTDLGVVTEGEILDEFELDEPYHLTYYGYKAPKRSGAPLKLLAIEDRGLKDGTVDVSKWFDDIGSDRGNLTFSTESLHPNIMPVLEGSLLSLRMTKDWNGVGNITVTATDPHGKSLKVQINIQVSGVNDQPMAMNPRILAMESDSPTMPRTHDKIMGVWEWYDIDGDPEPTNHIIRWYLNGTYQPYLDNDEKIYDVFSGQIWNFTLYPADSFGISSRIYGEPVHSPPIMVGNLPPTLGSVDITNNNPTTLTDLIVSPGEWDDPETGIVTFNYIWERRVSHNTYEPLGAPNSPILDHRFTRKGEYIRVKVWVSDGIGISRIRTDEVYIRNSAPYIISGRLMPDVVDEYTTRIYIDDIEWGDPDGDPVTLSYQWFVRGYPIAISDTLPELLKSQGNWNHPANISVGITPYDSDNLNGPTYYLSVYITPTDTDGDGMFDDADGDGINDPGDDKDDDNDGYQDDWENHDSIGTNPKDPWSRPLDTDGDGLPDGDPANSESWMDTDDDNDGVWDIHPDNLNPSDPDWYDSFPKTASMPGDMDYDGIGDDQDPDIDGDGYLNSEDDYPRDPTRHEEPMVRENYIIQILTLFLVVLIVAAIIAFVVLVYNGTITLPSQAPPGVEDGTEVILDMDEDRPGRAKLPPAGDLSALEEMEELENMGTCSQCGELVSFDEKECPNCGAVFEDLEEDGEEELNFDDDDD